MHCVWARTDEHADVDVYKMRSAKAGAAEFIFFCYTEAEPKTLWGSSGQRETLSFSNLKILPKY